MPDTAQDLHLVAGLRDRQGAPRPGRQLLRQAPHLHMFEHGLSERDQRLPVQRIMSVPVANAEGTLRWILQLSRKGQTLEESGPAFTEQDLQALERVAVEFARLEF